MGRWAIIRSHRCHATVPILKKYLDDERLSLTQIAELMNFTSLNYFSRYCIKHLGQSPSEYRQSLKPKGSLGKTNTANVKTPRNVKCLFPSKVISRADFKVVFGDAKVKMRIAYQ